MNHDILTLGKVVVQADKCQGSTKARFSSEIWFVLNGREKIFLCDKVGESGECRHDPSFTPYCGKRVACWSGDSDLSGQRIRVFKKL